MNKETILEKHLEFKKTSVHSKDKLKDIERYLSLFLNHSKKPLEKYGEEEIIKFLNSLTFSIRTLNDIKSYIKVFVKWNFPDWSLRFRNLDKLTKQGRPEPAFTPEEMLTYEEVEKIVKKENNLMWKTYWLVFFFGGFRPSEACRLKWSQVFFEPQGVIIKIHTTKTNRDFYKSLPKEAEYSLKELKSNSSSEYIFSSSRVGKDYIQTKSACSRLKRISKLALGKEVVPYQMRHSIATILYGDDKLKDDDIANQLGHSKDMRAVYKNLNTQQIKEKARNLWTKQNTFVISEEEKSNMEKLKQDIEELKKRDKLFFELLQAPKNKRVSDIIKELNL